MALTRDDVLAAALKLLDEEGLDRLTMRRVATRLNVQHGALYWHYADKQALLDAMAEHIVGNVAEIDPGAPALTQLEQLAWRLRDALLSHRDGARVVAGTFVTEPNTLKVAEAGVRAALAAGAPPGEAALAAFALQEYVLGHTIEEQARADLLRDDPAAPPVPLDLDRDRYPAFSTEVAHLPLDARGLAGFSFGLKILLAGTR
ncbi:MAG TPA: TetR/AcrR family transcriptional regulator C-terminal domain-containing protein, partial [Trebonia sp.]|nr:TetR/AcrR family transcriptional regulator C-terminal domain-containing protein [Trebonia sp.]